jgi:hypothetical protein
MSERKTDRDLWIEQLKINKQIVDNHLKLLESFNRLITALRYNGINGRYGIDLDQYNDVINILMREE